MQRLRQEAAAAKPKSKADAMDSDGLEAMRAALTATEAEAVAELVAAADRCDNSAPSAISVLMAGGQIDGLAKKAVKTRVAVDLGRKGPGDPRWHDAGKCRWVTPPGASDESSESWPALELPSGRGRKP